MMLRYSRLRCWGGYTKYRCLVAEVPGNFEESAAGAGEVVMNVDVYDGAARCRGNFGGAAVARAIRAPHRAGPVQLMNVL
jgi:hypothetical protein